MTPIARTADLFIPVRPGGDIGVFNGMLHVMIERGWIDRAFIAAHTTGCDAVEARRRALHAGVRARRSPACRPSMIVRAAELWGPARDQLPAARARHRAPLQGRRELHGGDQPGGRHRPHRPGRLRLRDDHRPGQRPGRARAGAEVRSAARARATSRTRSTARYIAERLGRRRGIASRTTGCPRCRCSKRSTTGRSRACCSICFNPLVSLPDGDFIREALERLEFFAVDRLLPVRDGALRRRRAAGLADGRGRRDDHQRRGARHPSPAGRCEPPGDAREDWRIICDLAQRLGAGDKFPYQSTREIFDELRVASQGGVADYSGITWERSIARWASSGRVPSLDHPGTPRLYEGGAVRPPRRQGALSAGRLAARRRGARRRVPDHPDHRPRGRRSTCPARRRGASAALVDQYPQPHCEIHPAPRRAARHRGRRLRPRREPPRRDRRAGAGREDDPARHRVRPVPLAARSRRPTTARSARSIRSRRSPSSRSAPCACRRRRADRRRSRALEPAAGGIR